MKYDYLAEPNYLLNRLMDIVVKHLNGNDIDADFEALKEYIKRLEN